MYICICNAIRETDLRQVAASTGGDAESVYATLGKRPNCGQCLVKAGKILDEERGLANAHPCCKELAI